MQKRIAQDFDWRLIRSFVAVLETGSLTAAARQVGAQQTTLGRHIAELEAQLGVALFERTGRGLAPTAAARSIAGAATRMQAEADALARGLHQSLTAARSTVRISASELAASYLLPPVIARLQEKEQSIQIELLASDDLSNLIQREADIAVRMAPPGQKTLIARRIGELRIVTAAHTRYLRRAGIPQTPADLLKHRLIGHDTRDDIVRGMQALGLAVTRESFLVRTDNPLAYGRLVGAGAGIGFLSAYNMRYLPGTQEILPSLKLPSLPCWLVVHREIRGDPVIRRVFDFLARELPLELTKTSG